MHGIVLFAFYEQESPLAFEGAGQSNVDRDDLAAEARHDGGSGGVADDDVLYHLRFQDTVHQAGDKGMFNIDTYRAILSFDTSALPDTATLDSVTLRIYRQALAGTVSR